MPHIISNPLDLMANGRTPSSASTLPLRGDSPAGSSSAVRSSQVNSNLHLPNLISLLTLSGG
jgi:hypothetical protein